jgi:hypothetical protein
MIAAILDAATLAKVILYSLISGVGVSAVFALGVTSAAGMVDAFRQRRTLAGALWAASAALSLAASMTAVVLGIIVITG